jgi:Protein of unknown function (DUF3108)
MTSMNALTRLLAAPDDGSPWWRPRPALVVALAISVGVHLALSLVPDEAPTTPDEVPLTATIQELPPPPVAAAPSAPKPKPRPKPRPAPVPVPEVSAPEPAPEAPPAGQPEQLAQAAPAAEPVIEPTPPVLAEDVAAPPGAAGERKTLPPRVDLAYKVFYGTQGFLIGQATYRFEHADNRYRIGIVGDARGLAALLFRGQGRVESRGLITPDGLQPHELIVDKFNKRGRERAEFDWENGIANLHDNKTAPLELPTYDLLALMWQFYFEPPESDVQTFALATTKRVYKVTGTRKRRETLEWANGPIETEMWHRTSEDGRTEGYAWFAPSLRWLPVKVRAETPRGTVEVLLDSIRVDQAHAVESKALQAESAPLIETPVIETQPPANADRATPQPPPRYEHTP